MAKSVKKNNTFGVLDNLPNPTHTHTDTQQPTHTQVSKPVQRELKTRRVQLVLKKSSVNSLDAYAKQMNTSRNDVVQTLIEDFLKNL